MAENVQQMLRDRLEDDGTAIATPDRTWTWREHLAEASAEAAAVIAALDAQRAPHVGTLLGNSPAMLRAMAGAGLGGYVLCGINTTRRGEGLSADVRRAECQLLLTDAEHLPLLEGVDLGDVRVVDVGSDAWAQEVAGAGDLTPLREVEAMDTFMMIFTSGTSGDPKAVQVAHLMVLFSGLNLVDRFSMTPDDVCYLSMPLLATPERDDDADNTLRVAFGNEASDRDIAEFARRFDCDVMDGFGSTELAIIILREPGTPPGSIGKGMDGVAIYDAETVTECPVARFDEHGALLNADEAVGELVNTTGGGYFQGYYNDPDANADRMRHGMYWSGDLAYKDADGWIYLAGRTADWMRVDGENLAAGPIERILQRLPALNRVAVYAVRDAQVGDQVMAAMVLNEGEKVTQAEFESFLREQPDLSPKAWPRYVRINHDLPATATNKVLKRELMAQGVTAGDGELWTREERGTAYA